MLPRAGRIASIFEHRDVRHYPSHPAELGRGMTFHAYAYCTLSKGSI